MHRLSYYVLPAWLCVGIEGTLYLLANADPASWEKMGLVGVLGVLLMGLVFWTKKQFDDFKATNKDEKVALVKDLKETQAMLLKAHTDAREVVTDALVKTAEADTQMAASLSELAGNQKEFTETLRNVKCLHQSGEHRAVNERSR